MVKTIEEMRSKALALQGDYMEAYQDMLEAFEAHIEARQPKLHYRDAYYVGSTDGRRAELQELRIFLGLDSE